MLFRSITGKGAIFVQASSITAYPAIARTMMKEIRRGGGTVRCGVEVIGITEGPKEVALETTHGEFKTDFVIVCAGLHADRMAALCGIDLDFRIVPFRGEYFRLRDSKNTIVKHLIYPVPDPRLPFLGVHLTPMIGGYVTVGRTLSWPWPERATSDPPSTSRSWQGYSRSRGSGVLCVITRPRH